MRIILGYGEFKGYSLGEIPEVLLQKLSRRFVLESRKHDSSDRDTLLITIAVHEELHRRQAGGERKKRAPTLKELASDIVKKAITNSARRITPTETEMPQHSDGSLRRGICCPEPAKASSRKMRTRSSSRRKKNSWR